ncbi:MAG TPA: cache domain-containing protein [Spirochaetota bacterium]|nr:cache domain-containing protein [Spirochaetota bacterium]
MNLLKFIKYVLKARAIICLILMFIIVTAIFYQRGGLASDSMDSRITKIVYQAHAFVLENNCDLSIAQKAFETDPRFIDNQKMIYIFMHSYDTVRKEVICIAQGARPELVGKNMWSLRTPEGRLIFQESITLLKGKEEFWLEYDWLNPYTNLVKTKRAFYKKIVLSDGRKAWVGSGYWKN